jgi:hypothetical protein
MPGDIHRHLPAVTGSQISADEPDRRELLAGGGLPQN